MGQGASYLRGKISAYYNSSSVTAKVLLCGLDAAGKTTLIYKLKRSSEVTQFVPVVGFNVEQVTIGKMKFTCWDIGGEDKIRPLWRHYYVDADGVIFMIDGNDSQRFHEAIDELLRMFDTTNDHLRASVPFLIMVNKQDLPNATSGETVALQYNFEKVLKRRKWYVVDTCAITAEGLRDGIDLLSAAIRDKENSPVSGFYGNGFMRLVEVMRMGWTPRRHVIFPKSAKAVLWGLLLYSERIQYLPKEILSVIMGYVRINDVEQVERRNLIKSFDGKYIKRFKGDVRYLEKQHKTNPK